MFRRLYAFQTHSGWKGLLGILGFIFMYLVILDNESYGLKIGFEGSILSLFWLDTIILYYLKGFDSRKKTIYSLYNKSKIFILLLMTIDLIVFISMPCYGTRPVRPFRILRCCKYFVIKLFLCFLVLR
jgi:hypothetical protein